MPNDPKNEILTLGRLSQLLKSAMERHKITPSWDLLWCLDEAVLDACAFGPRAVARAACGALAPQRPDCQCALVLGHQGHHRSRPDAKGAGLAWMDVSPQWADGGTGLYEAPVRRKNEVLTEQEIQNRFGSRFAAFCRDHNHPSSTVSFMLECVSADGVANDSMWIRKLPNGGSCHFGGEIWAAMALINKARAEARTTTPAEVQTVPEPRANPSGGPCTCPGPCSTCGGRRNGFDGLGDQCDRLFQVLPVEAKQKIDSQGLHPGQISPAVVDEAIKLINEAGAPAAVVARIQRETRAQIEAEPIPMLLHCPACGKRHIDEGEFATKPHATHACQHCGFVWRPAAQNTVGVRFLPGFKDTQSDAPRGDAELDQMLGRTIGRAEARDPLWKMFIETDINGTEIREFTAAEVAATPEPERPYWVNEHMRTWRCKCIGHPNPSLDTSINTGTGKCKVCHTWSPDDTRQMSKVLTFGVPDAQREVDIAANMPLAEQMLHNAASRATAAWDNMTQEQRDKILRGETPEQRAKAEAAERELERATGAAYAEGLKQGHAKERADVAAYLKQCTYSLGAPECWPPDGVIRLDSIAEQIERGVHAEAAIKANMPLAQQMRAGVCPMCGSEHVNARFEPTNPRTCQSCGAAIWRLEDSTGGTEDTIDTLAEAWRKAEAGDGPIPSLGDEKDWLLALRDGQRTRPRVIETRYPGLWARTVAWVKREIGKRTGVARFAQRVIGSTRKTSMTHNFGYEEGGGSEAMQTVCETPEPERPYWVNEHAGTWRCKCVGHPDPRLDTSLNTATKCNVCNTWSPDRGQQQADTIDTLAEAMRAESGAGKDRTLDDYRDILEHWRKDPRGFAAEHAIPTWTCAPRIRAWLSKPDKAQSERVIELLHEVENLQKQLRETIAERDEARALCAGADEAEEQVQILRRDLQAERQSNNERFDKQFAEVSKLVDASIKRDLDLAAAREKIEALQQTLDGSQRQATDYFLRLEKAEATLSEFTPHRLVDAARAERLQAAERTVVEGAARNVVPEIQTLTRQRDEARRYRDQAAASLDVALAQVREEKLRADGYWSQICDTMEALGHIVPETAPYSVNWAKKRKQQIDELQAAVSQLEREARAGRKLWEHAARFAGTRAHALRRQISNLRKELTTVHKAIHTWVGAEGCDLCCAHGCEPTCARDAAEDALRKVVGR